MLPWAGDGSNFGEWIHPFSEWVHENQIFALTFAILVPLTMYLVKAAIHKRRRQSELELEADLAKKPQRLPNETLERNRREEARYRREQSGKPSTKRSGGPRFK